MAFLGWLMLRLLKRWQAVSLLLGMMLLLWFGFFAADTHTDDNHEATNRMVDNNVSTNLIDKQHGRRFHVPEGKGDGLASGHSSVGLLRKNNLDIDNQALPLETQPIGRSGSEHHIIRADFNDVVSPIIRRGPVPNVNHLDFAPNVNVQRNRVPKVNDLRDDVPNINDLGNLAPNGHVLGEAMPDEENAAREVVDLVMDQKNSQQKFGVGAKLHDDNAALEEHSAELDQLKIKIGKNFEEEPQISKLRGTDLLNTKHVQNFEENSQIKVEKLGEMDLLRRKYMKKFQGKMRIKGKNLKKLGALKRENMKKKKKGKEITEKQKSVKEVEEQEESFHQLPEHQKELPEDKYDSYNNWRNLTVNEISKLSVLGRRLYLNEKTGSEQNKIFKIHIWKYLKYIESRLMKRFTNKYVDPFEECSVSNCKITSEDNKISEADAVLFHLHRMSGPPRDVPRKPNQLWVWMSDESPHHVFMAAKDRKLSHYNGYFNWSMSYRMDADVPVPYGRTVPLPKDQYLDSVPDYYKDKKKDIAILGSNCYSLNKRYEYIKEMQKYIPVDIYGRCGPLKCPGHFRSDCPLLNEYKFYLAFENSNCDDYVTEKVWWNALGKGAVPVVMGTTKRNYKQILPPNSFIHAADFQGPQQLALHLKQVLSDPVQYAGYHAWRREYRVVNEHGYFQSPVYHFCRLCEALNYNHRTTSPPTADLENYFDAAQHCYPPTWRN
uniref:Fucosyltransferase n=1 Tax=Hirondellea gigas TaxID=1518452 RepID=A0A2P2I3P5_9CRUS